MFVDHDRFCKSFADKVRELKVISETVGFSTVNEQVRKAIFVAQNFPELIITYSRYQSGSEKAKKELFLCKHAILIAAAMGDVGLVQSMSDNMEVDETIVDSNGHNAVMYAIRGGHLPVLKVLLRSKDQDMFAIYTSLLIAVGEVVANGNESGHGDVLVYLLEYIYSSLKVLSTFDSIKITSLILLAFVMFGPATFTMCLAYLNFTRFKPVLDLMCLKGSGLFQIYCYVMYVLYIVKIFHLASSKFSFCEIVLDDTYFWTLDSLIQVSKAVSIFLCFCKEFTPHRLDRLEKMFLGSTFTEYELPFISRASMSSFFYFYTNMKRIPYIWYFGWYLVTFLSQYLYSKILNLCNEAPSWVGAIRLSHALPVRNVLTPMSHETFYSQFTQNVVSADVCRVPDMEINILWTKVCLVMVVFIIYRYWSQRSHFIAHFYFMFDVGIGRLLFSIPSYINEVYSLPFFINIKTLTSQFYTDNFSVGNIVASTLGYFTNTAIISIIVYLFVPNGHYRFVFPYLIFNIWLLIIPVSYHYFSPSKEHPNGGFFVVAYIFVLIISGVAYFESFKDKMFWKPSKNDATCK